MNILVSGSGGLIGSAVIPLLSKKGHGITRLVRTAPQAGKSETCWNPGENYVDQAGLEGLDAVVHLAGENVAGRWTARKKEKIIQSRVQGTRLLCEALGNLSKPPEVLLCASAIGFYGSRGEEILNEKSGPGDGFLARVCQEWEGATKEAAAKGIRVVNLRFGMVLSPRGGALAKMLPLFRRGLGGRLGSGSQYISWVSIDDAAGAVLHALEKRSLEGPINVVSPNPVTNLEFTRALGKSVGRRTFFPMPAFAVRMVFGEMGKELLLGSTRVEPKRLVAARYKFQHPELSAALAGAG